MICWKLQIQCTNMHQKTASSIIFEWTKEFEEVLQDSNSLCIALFSTDRELLFANQLMLSFIKGEPSKSFINPSFDKLLELSDSKTPVFEGFLTLGDYNSINVSLKAQVYKRGEEILVVGGVDAKQLIEQNKTMHQLNLEISNLQRELIKEKEALENTLAKLSEANIELEKMNIDKDRFIAILAHDLRGPFGTLLGFSDLLSKNLHTYELSKIEKQVSMIHEVGNQTYELLNDLLLWSKVQSDKISFKPGKINFTTICHEVVNNLMFQATTKNISVNCNKECDLVLSADKNMLKTVLRNLVSNAIKFTNENGKINIRSKRNKINATITISDNGVGIDPGNISKLWESSQGYSTMGTANEKGSGLGLSLCKNFVERHGGKIWVESEPGKGSDFKFTLPLFNS